MREWRNGIRTCLSNRFLRVRIPPPVLSRDATMATGLVLKTGDP